MIDDFIGIDSGCEDEGGVLVFGKAVIEGISESCVGLRFIFQGCRVDIVEQEGDLACAECEQIFAFLYECIPITAFGGLAQVVIEAGGDGSDDGDVVSARVRAEFLEVSLPFFGVWLSPFKAVEGVFFGCIEIGIHVKAFEVL